jgi:hypothetical protein
MKFLLMRRRKEFVFLFQVILELFIACGNTHIYLIEIGKKFKNQ